MRVVSYLPECLWEKVHCAAIDERRAVARIRVAPRNGRGYLRTVKELLGHKSFAMTMRYAHLSDQHKREAVKMLA